MTRSLSHLCDSATHWLTEPAPSNPRWTPETWEIFKYITLVHGVAPLLYDRLRQTSWLDEDLRQWLQHQFRLNAQRVTTMQRELAEILALFAEYQLRLMPLKGSVLSTQFYEEAGHRPMADLDLLIRPDDLDAAVRLLSQLGYEQDITHWKHIEFVKPDNRRVISLDSEHPDNPRKVELHLYCRETFGGPTIDLTGAMWTHAIDGSLLGETATIPHPDALWLHLLVHHTYHLWQGKGRLIQLVDLLTLSPYLEQPQTLLTGVDARFTYPSLTLLQRYFPASVEPSLLAAQRSRVSPRFRAWVNGLDLVNTSHLNPKPPGLYLFKALRFSEGRPGEVTQALRFALLPTPAEIALDHPTLAKSRAPWLAYFLLPLDWLKRL